MGKKSKNKQISKPPSKSSGKLVIQEQQFSGPIPPPVILEQYSKILPNAPERIIAMAEKQQNHEHQTIDQVVKYQVTLDKIGQKLGFATVIIIMVFGFYALYLGNTIITVASLMIAFAPLAKIFIFDKKVMKTNINKK